MNSDGRAIRLARRAFLNPVNVFVVCCRIGCRLPQRPLESIRPTARDSDGISGAPDTTIHIHFREMMPMTWRTYTSTLICAVFAGTVTLTGPLALAQNGAIKVGHYGSLTGSEATFGKSTSAGIHLAIDEINAAGGIGGKKVALVEYDTKGEAREAGAVVTRLVTSDQVAAVLGEVASSLSLAGAPVCQQYKVPMISPSSTNPKVTLVGDYIFRTAFIDPFQGMVGAKYAYENKNARRAAVLIEQSSAYSVGLGDEFKKAFEKMGGTITTTQSYNKGDQDFTSRLTAIRATNPDVIYIPGYYTDIANIAVQARKLGISVPMGGGDGWDSEELIKNGGKAVEGCFYSNHAAPDDPSPKLQAFIKKFEDENGSPPDSLAMCGYDAANLLFEAMKKDPSATGEKLRDAIANTKDFEGVTGTINFNATRDAVKPAVVLEIKDGKPTFVARVNP
jgi:branched-chain amino acid transport system substrate-binding protein